MNLKVNIGITVAAWITCCLILIPTALSSTYEPGNMSFYQINQNDGLSHNNVECIYQDSDGFMWFGTRDGLNRFDGYEFKVFRSNKNDSSTISGNRILCITEDFNGYLWIGTYANGFNRYNRIDDSFTRFPALDKEGQISSKRVNEIKVFSDSSIWFCTDYGLGHYIPKSDSFTFFQHHPQDEYSLNSKIVYDIYETHDKEIYVATENNQIQKYVGGTGKFVNINYKTDVSRNGNYKKHIVEDFNGNLWIAAEQHGLYNYNRRTSVSILYATANTGLTSDLLTGSMSFVDKTELWMATDGGGINVFDIENHQVKSISKNEFRSGSLSTNTIYTIYFDKQGRLWAGTFGEGLYIHDPFREKFKTLNYSPHNPYSLGSKSVTALFQDSKGRIWVGTDGGGLNLYRSDGTFKRYLHNPNNSNSISSNIIVSIGEDALGNLLLGTFAGGFMSFDVEKNRITRFNPGPHENKNIGSNSIWSITRDSKDRIWLGMLNAALDLYEPKTNTFLHFGPESGNPNTINFSNVMAVCEDDDGDIWIGTEGAGIFIFDHESQRLYLFADICRDALLSKAIIKSLFKDKTDNIWIGTEGDGLYCYNKNTKELKLYTVINGLPSNIIQSIMEDDNGILWLGTTNGLSKYEIKKNTFFNFDTREGLQGREFNRNAILKAQSGEIFIGGTEGLSIFNPDSLKLNPNVPRVFITNLKILNKDVKVGEKLNDRVVLNRSITYSEKIKLTHKENIFTLEFTVLNFTLPEKNLFEYRLEGFDKNWNKTTSSQRNVTYTNLDPGEYIFKVRGANNDGRWSNEMASLKITILPPFWKTIWFKILIILASFLLVFSWFWYRLKLKEAQFRKTSIDQERRIIRIEKEKLENDLNNLTFHILHRNRSLIDQKNRLIGLSNKTDENVKNKLLDIVSKIDEEINEEKDWKFIEPRLDKVYKDFLQRLTSRHAELNSSEIKIAAYIRMGLSSKELSELMHKSIRAIENDRYRLRKKIGLDISDSLREYLNQL